MNEQIIEFDKVKERWAALAMTEGARNRIYGAKPFLSEAELRKNLKDTTDSREMIEKCGMPPLVSMDGTEEIIKAAGRGQCLTPHQLESVEKTLVAVRRMREYLARGRAFHNSLAYYDENLNCLEDLRALICDQIRGGAVDDRASKALFDLRSAIERCREKMRERAEALMRSNKECMADHFTTIRNGRVCVPVKKEYKFRVDGSVINKSSTGNTLFVEPAGVARIYEELQLLKIDEENEVYRILYTLTALVADEAEAMRENMRMMERLDYVFSKGKLSLDMDGTQPQINLERVIELEDARHPLMDRNSCVPLKFSMGKGVRGIVITGPNTGGKTVSIKTVALACVMAQCGLHVAARSANICMNGNVLCDIGDGQNLSENLSTFSAHIKNVLEILGEVTEESLVVMDELGSGTDPAEGMGIAVAILEELNQSGCLFLVTTHYPEVKEYAGRTKGVVNARMTFDRESLKPTYQMVIGEAGESCAFYIASRLGMPSRMLKAAAEAAYGAGAAEAYGFIENGEIKKPAAKHKIRQIKKPGRNTGLADKYKIGDSVMIYPDKKLGIVCEPVNDKGVLRVQMPNKKIWINHKRVKLHVAASQLYPEDYDFSIIFDTVENRKIRHDMERKYTDETIETIS